VTGFPFRRGRPAANRLYKVFPKVAKNGQRPTLGFREMETGDAAEEDLWTTGIVVGDFNRDGRLELMLSSGDSSDGKLRYFELSEPGVPFHHFGHLSSQHAASAQGITIGYECCHYLVGEPLREEQM
jgi:hypothetical protein